MNDFVITFDPSIQGYWGWWVMFVALFICLVSVGISVNTEEGLPKVSEVFAWIFITALVVLIMSLVANLLAYFLIEPPIAQQNAVEQALYSEGFDIVESVYTGGSGPAEEWFLGRDGEIRRYNAVYVTLDGDDEMRFFEISR